MGVDGKGSKSSAHLTAWTRLGCLKHRGLLLYRGKCSLAACRLPEADIEEAIKVFREMVTEKFKTKCVRVHEFWG